MARSSKPRLALIGAQPAGIGPPPPSQLGEIGADLWRDIVASYEFEDRGSYFFLPFAQQYMPLRALHLRTAGSPERLAPAVQQMIRSINPDLPVYDVRSMRR